MTAERRPYPQVDLDWGTQPVPDVIEVAVRRCDGRQEADPAPQFPAPQFPAPSARVRAVEPERPHRSPVLLGALFGASALAIVVLLGAMLWTSGSHPPDPRTGAGPAFAAYPPPGRDPYGSHSATAGSAPTTPSATRQAATAVGALPPATQARTAGSAAPTPSTPDASGGSATLRAGDRGPEVAKLQHLLFQQGFTYVSTTGTFDEATSRGVTQLQRDRSLSCDPPGVYGPCTRAALTG